MDFLSEFIFFFTQLVSHSFQNRFSCPVSLCCIFSLWKPPSTLLALNCMLVVICHFMLHIENLQSIDTIFFFWKDFRTFSLPSTCITHFLTDIMVSDRCYRSVWFCLFWFSESVNTFESFSNPSILPVWTVPPASFKFVIKSGPILTGLEGRFRSSPVASISPTPAPCDQFYS